MLSTIAKTYKLSRMSLSEWKLTSLDQPDANLLACNWGVMWSLCSVYSSEMMLCLVRTRKEWKSHTS